MARLAGVKTAGLKNLAKTTIELDRPVGECVRAVAKYAGFATPGALIEAMLVFYVQQKLPGLELEFVAETPEEEVSRRRASADAKQQRIDDLTVAGQRLDAQSQTPQPKKKERRKGGERRKSAIDQRPYPEMANERRKGSERRKG
jgi:hypothetical protein